MAGLKLNLSKLTLDELVDLRERIQSVLNERVEAEKRELEQRILSLKNLTAPAATSAKPARAARKTAPRPAKAAKPHPLKGKKAVAKYKGPNGQTWSGRGLAPRWLAELEKNGQKRETFLINR